MQTKKNVFQAPEVRVVEASAGSGKTYALAKRYIQLLLNPSVQLAQLPIRNILAITFTNKAAFEMKARILEFLKKIVLGKLSAIEQADIIEPLGITPDQARDKAATIMEELIHNYNFFQVQTIDKFINALLSGCAFKIGLTANFKIRTNVRDYLQYSLDELIDQAQGRDDLLRVFYEFLHHYLYLENRSGWFPKQDMLNIVTTLFRQNNTYGLNLRESPYSSEELVKQKSILLKEIKSLRDNLPEGADKRFVKSLDSFLVKNTTSFDIDSISDYFAREYLPVRKNIETPKELDALWEHIGKNLRQLCEKEANSLYNPYIHVFHYVMEGFYRLAAKDDVLFLEELNKKAGRLFGEDQMTVEELYYRLATRFRHYLIDEFQDTSRLQWYNLAKMTEEALSTGGTLFYVGDRKQAIYSFRGGEAALFDDVKNEFAAFNVNVDQLTTNWRSQKSVVEFNNSVFAMENLKRFLIAKEDYEMEKKKRHAVVFSDKDLYDVEKVFQNATQNYRPDHKSGYVKVQYVDHDRKEERDIIIRDQMIAQIKELKTRFAYRDIAILTRSNLEIEQITNWLLEENILAESERTLNIKENRLILELISFLKFLDSPLDNFSFISFILGDIFSAATGVKSQELHDFVFDLRERMFKEKDLYIYTEFRKAYPEIWEKYIEEFFKNIGLYPLYEFVISIYSQFDCLNHFPDFQGFWMHFLEIIKKSEDEYLDVKSFLEYFENLEGDDLYVHVTDSDAIKILTIHKSKGLEFPVVILPHLGMDIQIGASVAGSKQSYVRQEDGPSMELLRLKNKYLSFSGKLYEIYAKEYKKAFLAELNNIYVALTRAQCEIYAFIPKRVGNGFNFLKFLIPEDIYELGEKVQYPKKQEQSREIKTLSCTQYQDWINYLEEEFLGYDLGKNREQRQRGEILHYILSHIYDVKDQKQIQDAFEEAKLTFTNVESWEIYHDLIKKFLAIDVVQPFFDTSDAEIFTEKDVANVAGHTRRIDRLVVKDKEVWILDYKSRRESAEDYQRQVQEYCVIVKDIYPDRDVKGFLFYFDEMNLEKV